MLTRKLQQASKTRGVDGGADGLLHDSEGFIDGHSAAIGAFGGDALINFASDAHLG